MTERAGSRSRARLLAALVLASATGAAVAGAPGLEPLDPALVKQGQKIYEQYCIACHGSPEGGIENWDELNAQGELPPPPHGEKGHTWKHSDAMLYRMVKEGWRDPFNKTEHLTMPAFGDVLAPQEIRAVITYIKSFWSPKLRQFQQEETEARGGFPPEAQHK
jgi:mono/diheme cytochrome c family protein